MALQQHYKITKHIKAKKFNYKLNSKSLTNINGGGGIIRVKKEGDIIMDNKKDYIEPEFDIQEIEIEEILEFSNVGDGGEDNDETPWGDITWF